jgi:hypothetical protein
VSGDTIKVNGYSVTLDSGARVFVGLSADGASDDVYLRFMREDGAALVSTHVLLSRAAMLAVGDLFAKLVEYEKARDGVRMLVRYLDPPPFAYAGIPPVDDPRAWWKAGEHGALRAVNAWQVTK